MIAAIAPAMIAIIVAVSILIPDGKYVIFSLEGGACAPSLLFLDSADQLGEQICDESGGCSYGDVPHEPAEKLFCFFLLFLCHLFTSFLK